MANSGSSRKSSGKTQSGRRTVRTGAVRNSAASTGRTNGKGAVRNSTSSGRNTGRTGRSTASTHSRSLASGSRSRYSSSGNYTTSVRRRQAAEQAELIRDVKGIIIFAVMIFLFLCNFGILGKVGNVVSSVLFGLTGLPAYILPILILGLVFYHLQNREDIIANRKIGAVIGLYAFLCIICELVTAGMTRDSIYNISEIYSRCSQNKSGGGILFGSVAFFLYKFLGTVGCVLVLIVLFLICAIILSQQPLMHLAGERAADARSSLRRREIYDAADNESYDDEMEDDPEESVLDEEQNLNEDRSERIESHRAGNERFCHESTHPRSFWDYLYDSRERSAQQKKEQQLRREQQKLQREGEDGDRSRIQNRTPGMRSSVDENGDTIYHGILSDPLIGNNPDLHQENVKRSSVSSEESAADEIDAAIAAGRKDTAESEKETRETAATTDSGVSIDTQAKDSIQKSSENSAQPGEADVLSPAKTDTPVKNEKRTDVEESASSEDVPAAAGPRQNLHEIYYEEDTAFDDTVAAVDTSAEQTNSNEMAAAENSNLQDASVSNPFSALSAIDAADSQDPFTRKVIEESIGLASATEAAKVSSKLLSDAVTQTRASDLHEVKGSGSMTGRFPRKSSDVLSFEGEEDSAQKESKDEPELINGEELTPIGPADNDKDKPPYSVQEPVRRKAWPDENAVPAVSVHTDAGKDDETDPMTDSDVLTSRNDDLSAEMKDIISDDETVSPDREDHSDNCTDGKDADLQKYQSIMLQKAQGAVTGKAVSENREETEKHSPDIGVNNMDVEAEDDASVMSGAVTDSHPDSDTKAEKKSPASVKTEQKPAAVQPQRYIVPPMDLLEKGSGTNADTNEELRSTAQNLQQTLKTFGVNVHITAISQGPAVTRYELQPEQGVKVSRIVSLSDDIKLALAATDIRIEAPIPGKSAIGIEVPNRHPAVVKLRDVLDTEDFRNSKSKVSFALGKDISGRTVISNIAKMPHLLIAGATGSGKSVCINTIIMSIIYHARPDEVKLLMIDPKVVELSVYNGIPHLSYPVVTDPQKAAALLKWAVAEMEERYKKFAASHVRNISGYNAYIRRRHDEGQDLDIMPLPEMVIIVDELADLMMVAKNDVETSICRLTQLARAAGMYLIIATQRPSVDVITGLIKANMPSRIAFAVSSGTDSRTILDMNGAEKLLGKGDMLYSPAGSQKPVRVQGAFVSDEEVAAVVNFLLENNSSVQDTSKMDEQINQVSSESAAEPGPGASSEPAQDELFVDAGKFIIERQNASIGLLQRRFRIGFNRAARIMDQLCDAGVVAESEGTKSRRILMDEVQFDNYCENM